MFMWMVVLPPSGKTPPCTKTARMASSLGNMEMTTSPAKASFALAAIVALCNSCKESSAVSNR
jgi:hypothetical protein